MRMFILDSINKTTRRDCNSKSNKKKTNLIRMLNLVSDLKFKRCRNNYRETDLLMNIFTMMQSRGSIRKKLRFRKRRRQSLEILLKWQARQLVLPLRSISFRSLPRRLLMYGRCSTWMKRIRPMKL